MALLGDTQVKQRPGIFTFFYKPSMASCINRLEGLGHVSEPEALFNDLKYPKRFGRRRFRYVVLLYGDPIARMYSIYMAE